MEQHKDPFEHILGPIPAHITNFIKTSMDVSDIIVEILERKGWTQNELANKLEKSPSEISKWLTGSHNFTLRSIAKIEAVLEEKLLVSPMYWKEYEGAFQEKQEINPSPQQLADIYQNLGDIAKAQGNLEESRDYYLKALAALEGKREKQLS